VSGNVHSISCDGAPPRDGFVSSASGTRYLGIDWYIDQTRAITFCASVRLIEMIRMRVPGSVRASASPKPAASQVMPSCLALYSSDTSLSSQSSSSVRCQNHLPGMPPS